MNNHLFILARSGKRLTPVGLMLVLGFVFVFVSQLIGLLGGILSMLILALLTAEISPTVLLTLLEKVSQPNAERAEFVKLVYPTTALETTLYLIWLFGPLFLILCLWLTLVEKRPFWTIGLERSGAVLKYLRGFMVGLIMIGGAVGLSGMVGYIDFEQGNPQKQGGMALGGVLIILIGWLVQGAGEEILTRGWLLPVIGARYRPWWGVIISSVFFSALHSMNADITAVAFLNLFLVGIFAALYALKEGSLWGVCSFHSAWNWAQGNLLGFEVSGTSQAAGTLINLKEVGPDVITGGAFGPEGGLSVTVVLLIGCVVIWILDYLDFGF